MYKMYMVNIYWYLVNIASKLYITSPLSELKFAPTNLLISYILVQNYFDLNYIYFFNIVIACIFILFYNIKFLKFKDIHASTEQV